MRFYEARGIKATPYKGAEDTLEIEFPQKIRLGKKEILCSKRLLFVDVNIETGGAAGLNWFINKTGFLKEFKAKKSWDFEEFQSL